MRKWLARQAAGAQSRAEYEGNSKAATKPWEKAGTSRSTWYENRRRTQVGQVRPQYTYTQYGGHTCPTSQSGEGTSEGGFASKQESKSLPSSRTGTTLAADGPMSPTALVLELVAMLPAEFYPRTEKLERAA
jgi:hypothetical protein